MKTGNLLWWQYKLQNSKKKIAPIINRNEEQKEDFSEILNSARTIDANVVKRETKREIVVPTTFDGIIDKKQIIRKKKRNI